MRAFAWVEQVAVATAAHLQAFSEGRSDVEHAEPVRSADDKAAAAATDALAKAGFRGTAKHGDKALAFPGSNAEKGAKADTVTIAGVHLCCPACYTAAEKALKTVDGVTAVKSDKKAKTLEVTGAGVDVNAAIGALLKAGFQASVKK